MTVVPTQDFRAADLLLQGTRLLRLHTVLGPDALIAERLDLHESIGPEAGEGGPRAGLRATVQAVGPDAHLELKRLIGQPALVQLRRTDGSLRDWHAHVTGASLLGADGGLARHELTLEPWLACLAWRTDSWVFQNLSVPQILDEVFADYLGQGPLAPAWRWDLQDPAAYPARSLCMQYQESDLAFVQRLMREEGLCCWWEHEAAEADAGLGAHTLVIADHPAAWQHDLGPVRFTHADAGLKDDSLHHWRHGARVASARVSLASADYRRCSLRPVEQAAGDTPAGTDSLALSDVPGQYAYEDAAQGERLVRRQVEALDAWRQRWLAVGSFRDAAAGSTFTLVEHPRHDGTQPERDRFVILAAHHRARSNLHADRLAGLDGRDAPHALANDTEEPEHHCELTVQPAALPVRMASLDARGLPDVRLHARPTVVGVQTAVVVGLSDPVHTDRDHRVRIQFHWQRGRHASHRLAHAAGCNAPGDASASTWVRVAESVAGDNWGHHFVPRVGQEVLVGFVAGDIDRPVVLGALYNGQGTPDAHANEVRQGAAGANASTPAWFPGSRTEGRWPGHQHPAALSGMKTQELSTSATGGGGHNQLLFDDSPGAQRIELSTTAAQTRLQLGHLRHQPDNRLLQPRGHGVDLSSAAWGAVRAGSGLLLSAHAADRGTGQMQASETLQALEQGGALIHSLAESAQQHAACLPGEPPVSGPGTGAALPAEQALHDLQATLQGQATHGGAPQAVDARNAAQGGSGTVSAWQRPDLLCSAPGGVGLHTPAHRIDAAGATAAWVAGQDIQHAAQRHHATSAADGIVLYTVGAPPAAGKPHGETGVLLHAATGTVHAASLTGRAELIADAAAQVSSTTGMVRISAPAHVLLTAAGAAIELRGDHITLQAPGAVRLRASMKELTGPASAHAAAELHAPGVLQGCDQQLAAAAAYGGALVDG
ncbi:MAG: type VI secretion system tip protein VgrG [Burkholderiales bacterium]|nr:type VI secretion system tip protein VgrG [Burkholderiales bacterium]